LKLPQLFNTILATLITTLTAVFGIYWYIFAAYLLLNILDWLTGWHKARSLHQESSIVGLRGIIKKTGYWVIIAVAFLAGSIFQGMGERVLGIDLSFLQMIGYFTLACLMVNKMRSILENLVELGYQVPAVLIKGLAAADKIINKDEEQ